MQIKPNSLRKIVLKMVFEKQSGHIGGCFSIAELIAYLFNEYNPLCEDKIILSKGHAVPIIYAALFEKNILHDDDLSTFREINSKLQGHPVHWLIPQLIATTGSLGQGLSIAAGHALAKKINNENGRVFCILGDGEMQEGQIYEALMFCKKYNLANLTIILDSNGAQNDGLVKDIMPLDYGKVIEAFGLNFVEIKNGNDYSCLEKLRLELESSNKCSFVVLNTTKGFGVDFMQSVSWHSKAPNEDQYNKALDILNENSNS